jgi:hypothetical protein
MKREATLSPDETHRYTLTRILEDDLNDRTLTFILLNPSTADDTEDDPATKKCIEIAREHNFRRVEVVNLFSVIESDSQDLRDIDEPLRPENDEHILAACEQADKIICGWGDEGEYMNRSSEVYNKISDNELECLRINQSGEPTYINPNGPLRHKMNNDTQPYEKPSGS